MMEVRILYTTWTQSKLPSDVPDTTYDRLISDPRVLALTVAKPPGAAPIDRHNQTV